jgi:hypothetical protein
VWAVGFRNKSGSPSAKASSPASSSAPAAGTTVLKPAGVNTFNVFGSDSENASTVKYAVDGSTSTAWTTDDYLNYPNFGNSKPGTGLLIDMGKKVKLSQVEVLFGSGTISAEIYLGNSNTMSKSTGLKDFTLVSANATATGKHDFPVSSKETGRYVLIWLTRLPKLSKKPAGVPQASSYYQGMVYNVVVRGSAASGSS